MLPTECPASTPCPPIRCCSRSAHWTESGSVPASAATAIRRSPGGRTFSSRRIRPDDPPSSATVTTAVRSVVSNRRADSDACRPWPPPRATARSGRSGTESLTAEVPVHHGRVYSHLVQSLRELLGHRDRAVLAAGTADRQGQVALPFAGVASADDLQD